jgi:hypothetical protein
MNKPAPLEYEGKPLRDDRSALSRAFDEPVEAGSGALAEIVKSATRAVFLEHVIEGLDEELTRARKELNELKFVRIPDAMAQAGLTSFALADGSQVKVEDFVQGSLPKDPLTRTLAVSVLEQHGGEALIRNQVVVPFDRKDHNRAINLARELEDRGLMVNVVHDVHAQTLQAFVREKLRAGEQLPWEALGIFVGRRAKITPAAG